MQTLNRKQRRAMARNRKPHEYITLEEPAYMTKWRVFDGIDRILTSLENGEILSENGVPVFIGVTGEVCQVVPSLEGWILMWKRATEQLNLPVDTHTPFELIRRALSADKLLSADLVAVGRHAYSLQRTYYDQHPQKDWQRIARDVRIQIYLQPEAEQEAA